MSNLPSRSFVFVGGDDLQRQKNIQALIKKRFGAEEYEFHRYLAAQGQIPSAVEEVLSFSLFSPNKVVQVNHMEKASAEELAPIIQFLGNPRGDALLILCYMEDKKVPAALQKVLPKEAIIQLSITSASQLRTQIEKTLQKQQLNIASNAMDYLLETCAHDPEMAMRETEKLILWGNPGDTISLETCRLLVQNQMEEQVWNISNAVADKKPDEALIKLKHLFDQGVHPLIAMTFLIRTFRQMYHFKTLVMEKTPTAELAKRIGVSPGALNFTRKNCSRFSLAALQKGIDLLRQADEDIKGGKPASPEKFLHSIMERLVIDLCKLERPDASI